MAIGCAVVQLSGLEFKLVQFVVTTFVNMERVIGKFRCRKASVLIAVTIQVISFRPVMLNARAVKIKNN